MVTRFYEPHISLQEFVQCIMVIHAEVDSKAAAIVCPYPPSPQNSIFFYINDPIKVQKEGAQDFLEQPRSVIVGPMVTKVLIDINNSHKAVRVGFHPGGLHRLLRLSMAEMLDGDFDATDVFGPQMKQVNEQLQEAKDFDEIKNVVEKFLLQKAASLKQALPFDAAMLQLVQTNGNMSIEKVAYNACLSLRQFERVCKERIGMSPKMYARIIRFSKAYRMRENNPQLSWTSIAHHCGYFDQMHFIRDFKDFTGALPKMMDKHLEQAPVKLQASLRL